MFSIFVDDYDFALRYFVDVLEFSIVEDTQLTDTRRWVVITSSHGLKILLVEPKNERERSGIGQQFFGRVGVFLYVDEFDRIYTKMKNASVEFLEEPRSETYGKVVQFKDYLGNKWDLIESSGS